jgi:hypothetical protein
MPFRVLWLGFKDAGTADLPATLHQAWLGGNVWEEAFVQEVADVSVCTAACTTSQTASPRDKAMHEICRRE